MVPTGKALVSGMLAAASSCVAKLCLQSDSWIPTTLGKLCRERYSFHRNSQNISLGACDQLATLSQIISMILVILLNGLMMSHFLDGLAESGSISATALSTAANFFFSAAFGLLLFKESISFQWLVGFSIVLLGICLLSSVQSIPNSTKSSEDNQGSITKG